MNGSGCLTSEETTPKLLRRTKNLDLERAKEIEPSQRKRRLIETKSFTGQVSHLRLYIIGTFFTQQTIVFDTTKFGSQAENPVLLLHIALLTPS